MHQIFEAFVSWRHRFSLSPRMKPGNLLGTRSRCTSRSFPNPNPDFAGTDAIEAIGQLMRIRDAVQAKIEEAIQAGVFSKNERAAVSIGLAAGDPALVLFAEKAEEVSGIPPRLQVRSQGHGRASCDGNGNRRSRMSTLPPVLAGGAGSTLPALFRCGATMWSQRAAMKYLFI